MCDLLTPYSVSEIWRGSPGARDRGLVIKEFWSDHILHSTLFPSAQHHKPCISFRVLSLLLFIDSGQITTHSSLLKFLACSRIMVLLRVVAECWFQHFLCSIYTGKQFWQVFRVWTDTDMSLPSSKSWRAHLGSSGLNHIWMGCSLCKFLF